MPNAAETPLSATETPSTGPNLTDFLLARIAEDRGRTAWHHRLLCLRTACDAECCWGDSTDEQIAAERVCTCNYPARVLAECEAKRRIVAAHPRCDVHDLPGDECDACQTCGDGSIWPCPTLLYLAAVYADHPDYREEWRP